MSTSEQTAEKDALYDRAVTEVSEHLDPRGYGWAAGDGPGLESVCRVLVDLGWRPARACGCWKSDCRECGPRRRGEDHHDADGPHA